MHSSVTTFMSRRCMEAFFPPRTRQSNRMFIAEVIRKNREAFRIIQIMISGGRVGPHMVGRGGSNFTKEYIEKKL